MRLKVNDGLSGVNLKSSQYDEKVKLWVSHTQIIVVQTSLRHTNSLERRHTLIYTDTPIRMYRRNIIVCVKPFELKDVR